VFPGLNSINAEVVSNSKHPAFQVLDSIAPVKLYVKSKERFLNDFVSIFWGNVRANQIPVNWDAKRVE